MNYYHCNHYSEENNNVDWDKENQDDYYTSWKTAVAGILSLLVSVFMLCQLLLSFGLVPYASFHNLISYVSLPVLQRVYHFPLDLW